MKKLLFTVAAVALISAPAVASDNMLNTSPSLDRLEAFEVMDLDNNYIVNDIEYKFSQANYAGVQGYSFSELDINGNGIITRDEASVEPYGDIAQEAEVAVVTTEQRIEASLDLND